MGMAASQARFLMLTARKSNVEYEGQQVNQQRTALANESANLYNQLSSIKVPTPPTTSDYYETVYTFKTSELNNTNTGSTEYTLNNIYTTPDGTFANLTYMASKWQAALTTAYAGDINTSTSSTTGKTSYSISLMNGVVAEAKKYHCEPQNAELKINLNPTTNSIQIGSKTFALNGTTLADEDNDESYTVTKNSDGSYSITLTVQKDDTTEPDPYFYYNIAGIECRLTYDASTGVYSCTVPTSADPAIDASKASVENKYVDDDGKANSAVKYLSPSFLENNKKKNQPILAYVLNNQTYFVSAAEFANNQFNSSTYINEVQYPVNVDYPCTYSTASTGRYQTLTVTDDYGRTHDFQLNVTTVQDESAYEQAMLDYEYEQAKYQKKVQDINSKTEVLQKEDRTLELRLKQLDTEQNAISTEMDSVKKVIEDNVDATFKTFA